jgi:D-alanine--poly(phosphoribitol) ligase subunit 2
MNRTDILELIRQVIAEVLAGKAVPGEINEETRLFGGSGVFDSLGLVTLITEAETQINDRCGTSILIASEKAMSQQRSPFRSVGTLTDYIVLLLADEANAVTQS